MSIDHLSVLAARMTALDPRRPRNAAPIVMPAARPSAAPADELIALTLKDAARLVGVSVRTLTGWERFGLPIVRVCGVVRILRADLQAFLAEHRTPQPAADAPAAAS
jgi:hypothetical protein